MDEYGGHNRKRNKPVKEGQIVHDSIYKKNLKKVDS